MSKKSWVVMTGLCVLMATSAAQAHLIQSSVEDVEGGAEASRFETRRAHSAWDWALEGADKRRDPVSAHAVERALGQQASVAGLISRVPPRASDHSNGRNGQSIVDRICDRLPVPPTKVPEPETLALLMAGLLGVAVTGRRRKPAAER